MVERVAKIFAREQCCGAEVPCSGPAEHCDCWKSACDAIGAMREPTEVLGAGAWTFTVLYVAGRVDMDEKDVDLNVISCIWNSMIDECLNPGTSPVWEGEIDEALR
jgi:hypothetical protein